MSTEEETVTVRFKLKDTVKYRNKQPHGYEFYQGTWMRYFADRPIMWWPEDSQDGLPMDRLAEAKLNFLPPEAPDGPVLVEMTLPRSRLPLERRCPYTIVEEQPAEPA
ncbi:hypothetical protein ABZX72_29690 [Streptomyces cyaneofuscatus]|uniref:hypothetical protein n=1 Tax=Streptomyces cyaneofuscatus TaxID=66883 RepID=UPI0033ADE541